MLIPEVIPTFRHILIPVDLTAKNRVAVAMAVRLAAAGRTRVTLIHVIELIQGLPFEELEVFYRRLEMKARTDMAPHMKGLKRKNIAVHGEITYGHRVEEIITYAVKRRVDLIVMSSHKVDLATPGQEWGTISHKVSILSQCPVMLVK